MALRARLRGRLHRDLGRRLAELRQSRGLTQQAFAERLDVSLRYVQSVEAGWENPTVGTLEKLAKALRVPVAELFASPASRAVRRGRPVKRRAESD
ncbi:MAG: helix-turn-helix domain-containing protein [Myxococcales bacterium]|nr:helix-turn-helix domain-containing protein [Myxococcales bacterium]